MAHILCGGLITVDFTFHTDAFPVEGTKNRASATDMAPGGGAFFAASAIAALGGQASVAGAVGEDALADFVHTALKDRGIGTDHLHTIAGVGTARSAVIVGADGERTVINHRDDALFPDTFDLPFSFDAALVDTRWPGGGADILRAAQAAGKPAILDGESPVRVAQDAVDAASHIVFSEQGLTDFAGACDADTLAEVARSLGLWVAVTRGSAPVLCHDGSALHEVATFPATPVNTLGAGDVWHGAFALALGAGHREITAVCHANAAAALKVAHAGAMPTADQVNALLGG
ncbi:PfkB family carbohydrate kinase [Oceaniglobus ichthyenteri]|uniref:PfkB family carbohydrate kinase n=1 Tax=Oceaniglobus ichthyenteri TaxID=2136177 RepID=UPI0013DE4DFD|nr:PfkB family carbohydrate kinase [Oceaniglobus ichthyenteri]